MLTLNDGRSELWQWDTGRKLNVDADCSQVHFSNKVFGRSIDVDVVDGVATIPDILLQTDKDLNAWAFVGTAENGYTKISKTFKVNRRNKPADYVFTPPDQTSLEEIKEKVEYLESFQDPDAIKNAVEDYLEQNPVEAPVQSVNGKIGKVELTAEDVGAISQDDLQEATNEALAQAKASGEFDGSKGPKGDPGEPGADGTDYILTDADKTEIAEMAAELVEIPDSGQNGNQYGFLNGLKYYALGDSIVDMQGTLTAPETFGDTGYTTDLQGRDISGITVEGYVTAIERRYGLAATNFGKGGHTLVGDFSTLATMDYSDVALVTIAYGVNDARTGVPLGTVNSTDGATFAGALNNILRKIYTDNPECRVLVLSPMQRLTVTDFGIATPNVNGDYLIDFVDMCRKVAEKRSTAFLDQYRCCGINQTNLYYYTVEGVHPVNQGFARIRNAVIGILDEQFALEYEPIGVMTNTGDTEPDEPDTGGDSGGDEPPVEDTEATTVELTADMFTMAGVYYDATGSITGKEDIRSNASPIELIPGKTYTLVTYLSNRYSDTKAYFGTLAEYADFPTTTGGNGLRTDKVGASFEDNAAMFGNVNHAKITYTWVATDRRKYLFAGTTKLSDELMIELSYV